MVWWELQPRKEMIYSVRFRFLFLESLEGISGSEREDSDDDGGNVAWAANAAS